jgi:eukaryotic-like serine/threonine-protein kinase
VRHEGPDTEVIAESTPEPFVRGSAPPLHPHVLERFEVGRCLGAGTFGVVYEARERASGTEVALKKLSISDAAAIYAFKQEFRALADVVHENLVRLDELFSIDDELYLSMELVEGESFLDYVRAAPDEGSLDPERSRAVAFAAAPTESLASAISSGATQGGSHGAEPAGPTSGARARARGLADVGLLRAALRQLALGVLAVHRAKKLHRDLKPSNVLCTHSGRVVILDFGLVAAPGPRRERRVVGTPAYMSPEQARGLALGPASDWYSVGVMLYEALTGELPIDGDVRTILESKQVLAAPDPRARAGGVPDDLAELCLALLDADPRVRATGATVLRALGSQEDARVETALHAAPLVGREHHLAALEEAFATSHSEQAVTMLVHGTSGMGKSALCRRFLEGIVETQGALVLEGRCYEREMVPFKALDPLVDALADYLGGLPREAADALLPPDVPALSRLFPVLRHAPAVAAIAKSTEALDPQEARRRAGIALRRILERLAATAPLVLAIDDLQWGDADSTSLLLDLLAPPDPPRLLLLAGYRSEDAAGVHLAAALHRRMAHGEPVGDVRELWVGPLGPREARALSRALLAPPAPPDGFVEEPAGVAAIARESGGNPFFVHELARHARASGGHEAGAISLGDVLRQRVEKLPGPSRRLLEVIAVAGRPIGVEIAERAAGVGAAGALSILRAESLVKSRGSGGARSLEPFHDRIREAVLAHLAPGDVAQRSLALALTLEAAGTADPESLLVYFEAGGDMARARACAESAAVRAEEALAFDRAAALYRRALADAPDPRPLRIKLAGALVNAGRGAEAGRAYLDATDAAPPEEALDLRRRAAEQFLRAGHVDEGLAAVREVLEAVDLSLPETPARALASLLYRRARLSVRGLGFAERADSASPEELTRIDVCWSVGNGLHGVDIVRGADFQARHLLYALHAGEPSRIARALASQAIFASMEGSTAGRRRAARLVERSAEIAARIHHAHAVAWAEGARAGTAFYEHRFRDAAALSDSAVSLFRSAHGDNVWELGSIIGWFLLPALWFLGSIDEIGRRLPAYLKEAEDLGALYNLTSLRTLMVPRLLLAQNRPVEARRESQLALSRWSQAHGWHAQHCCDMYTRAHAALYMGDGPGAYDEVERSARPLERSFLLRVESVRIDCVYLRGSAAVAAAPRGSEGGALLKIADRAARALGREERPYARAFGRALAAAVALERGRLEPAAALYAEAASDFDALEMRLHAAAMRWRRAGIVLGDEGRVLFEAADRWMREQGVARPDRMVAMLAPLRE